jgi:hypothetical protein
MHISQLFCNGGSNNNFLHNDKTKIPTLLSGFWNMINKS